MILFKNSSKYDGTQLSNDYVPVSEVLEELQFSVYSNTEWTDFFANYPSEFLTNEMVQAILEKLGVSKVITYEEKNTKKAVTRERWNHVYQEIVDYLDIKDQIIVKDILVLKSKEENQKLIIETNEGSFLTKLPEHYFEDFHTYQVYLYENQCVGIVEEIKQEILLENAYILSATNECVSFLYRNECYIKDLYLGEQTILNGVADFIFLDGNINTIRQKQDYFIGRMLSYADDYIEIDGYGKLNHSNRMPVYSVYEEVKELTINEIVLGNMEARFVIGDNEVCAIILTSPAYLQNVRVLLLAEDGKKYRESVYFVSDDAIYLQYEKEIIRIEPGNIICANDYLEVNHTLILKPEFENQVIRFCNENGKVTSNPYAGNMEVRQYEEGYCVVNEVPIETYLYSVVPSEMPSSYEMEALKAQAVCARSYAYIQILRADLAAFGAHIDDSTSYQVYNKVNYNNKTKNAVDETVGKVMQYDGNVIEAFYFSTSYGYTDTALVWNTEESAYPYLKRVCLNNEEFQGDLSEESDFKLYLTKDLVGCDSNIKYYRWQIKADYQKLTDEIKDVLNSRRKAVNRHITFWKNDGVTETESLKDFGKLKGISVKERSKAGSILALEIAFEKGKAIVRSEYNIRKVLAIGAKSITYKDGSTSESMTLLPSAFCTVEKQKDGSYLLYGGGYGHGLGMSQNGANGLAKKGYTYEDILKFFYKDIEVVDIGESL